jgi:hypothetical protein
MSAHDDDASARCPKCGETFDVHELVSPKCDGEPLPLVLEPRHEVTKPYRPSNGEEGLMFQEAWCDRCMRDRAFRESDGNAEGCSILSSSMLYETDDPKYPKEWVWEPAALQRDGGLTIGPSGARCTAFEEDK